MNFVCFDKTGTLTSQNLMLKEVVYPKNEKIIDDDGYPKTHQYFINIEGD